MPGLTKSAPTQAGVGSQDHAKPSWHNRGHSETRLSRVSSRHLWTGLWLVGGPASPPLPPCFLVQTHLLHGVVLWLVLLPQCTQSSA